MPTSRPDDITARHLSLEAAELKAVVTRLRRVQGQLGAVATMLEEGRGCRDVVTQLSAAKKALDRTGYVLLEAALHQCLTDPTSAPEDVKTLQRLFLSLS